MIYISFTLKDALYDHMLCDPLDATNAFKFLIDQSEERILLIDQSKNVSKHL